MGADAQAVRTLPSLRKETQTSLLFGRRAMDVAVNPTVNEEIDYKALALDLQASPSYSIVQYST